MFDKIIKQKSVFAFLFIFLFMFIIIRSQAFAADSLQGANGYGDNWTFDQDTGILTVLTSDGRDNADAFLSAEENAAYKSKVKHLVLGSKVKKVIDYYFAGYENLVSVTLPNTFQSYMPYSFIGDKNLADVYYLGTETDWKAVDLEENYEPIPIKDGYSSDDIVLLEDLKLHYCIAPTLTVEYTSKGVKLTWDETDGASGYEIYRKESGQKWQALAETTKLKYTDKTVEAQKAYSYKIRAVVKGMATPFGSFQNISTVEAKATKITSIANREDGISVKWKKMAGAKRYVIYRKTGNGEWKWYSSQYGKDINKLFVDTNVVQGKKYSYKVAAVYKYYTQSEYSEGTLYRLEIPAISSLKNNGAGKLTVKWKKSKKVTGYEIKYIGAGTTKTISVKGADKSSKTISSLKKGKTYKVYVRSYKKASGKKYYSAWSPVSKKKVK